MTKEIRDTASDEVFTVERADYSWGTEFISVFPTRLGGYSQNHTTEQDAWDYIEEIRALPNPDPQNDYR